MRGAAAALGALLLLAGCETPPSPAAEARYMVGQPYQLQGRWYYPREDFSLNETGLAAVSPDSRAGRRTANGEIADPAALAAAHRTLQLPAVVQVTNLENGRSLLVRVNDHGPADPGRVIELSRRAATLLGIQPGRPAQVRVAVEGELSRRLGGALPAEEGARPQIVAAPVGAVQRESLAPIEGARQASRLREGRGPMVQAAAAEAGPAAPVTLPERVTQGPAMPGRLYVEGSRFTGRTAAQRQAARLGGQVEAVGSGRQVEYRVRLGPFGSPAEADRALAGAFQAGAAEARIVVD